MPIQLRGKQSKCTIIMDLSSHMGNFIKLFTIYIVVFFVICLNEKIYKLPTALNNYQNELNVTHSRTNPYVVYSDDIPHISRFSYHSVYDT